jgi:hemoglobin
MESQGWSYAKSAALALIVLLVIVLAAWVGCASLRAVSRASRRERRVAPSLYDRLGGAFAIAGLVDYFSDEILKSPLVGVNSPNPQLREWSRKQAAARLPGLKFMRSLWVCDVAGGPMRFHSTKNRSGRNHLDLSVAHRGLRITSQEFDEVARILARSLDHFRVPPAEKSAVLGAFAAHKGEVVSA